jgi:cytochrome bd ubiquinol oxidase subunit II
VRSGRAGRVGHREHCLRRLPYVLPSTLNPSLSLTVYNSAAPLHSLEIGLAWFAPALMLAVVYLVVVYRSFAGKVRPEEEAY